MGSNASYDYLVKVTLGLHENPKKGSPLDIGLREGVKHIYAHSFKHKGDAEMKDPFDIYFAEESTMTNGTIHSAKNIREKFKGEDSEDFEYYLGKYIDDDFYPIFEQRLTAIERRALPDSVFGLPEQRKYPMHDESHVKDAIRFFHFCKGEDRKQLAKAIQKMVKKYHMETDLSKNKLISKYL